MKEKVTINHVKQTKELLQRFELEENEITKIMSVYKFEKIKKGDIFIQEGESTKKVGILFGGILYAYSTNKDGDKNISRFFYLPDNVIVVNLESFIHDIKSEETIECFEDAFIVTIEKSDLYKLYEEIPQLNSIGRLLAEDSYIKALRKIKLLQTKNARDRILILREQSPELFKKLPGSYIASYLGMHRNTYNNAFSSI